MALRAGEIIEAARYRHPQFTREIVPTSVAVQFLTELQHALLLSAHQLRPTWLTRTWAIALKPDQQVAEVGPGSVQGAPLIEGTTSLERSPNAAGALAQLDPAASVLEAENAVTSGGASTLTDTTRSWTVDYFAGQRVVILTGTGAGQVREIASNTADTLTVTQPWAIVPDSTMTYRIERDDTLVDGSVGAILGDLPVTQDQLGWLVRLDASGQPYLDLSAPLTIPISQGIPLPPNFQIDHGTVKISTGQGDQISEDEFTIIEPTSRFDPPRQYCGYVMGQQLYLTQPYYRWRGVTQIEIPYLPLATPITGASSLLILPEMAREALVAGVANLMLSRASQMGVAGQDDGGIPGRSQFQMSLFLNQVSGVGRARVGIRREVW